MKKSSSRDTIYFHPSSGGKDFVFDQKVARVFEDMIKRSVPGYELVLAMTGTLARQYAQPKTYLYDLGCSLGASAFVMRENVQVRDAKIVAVDNSSAMIEKCRENLKRSKADIPVELICEDIQKVEIKKASMVVLNFTLQFVRKEQREEFLRRIYKGMEPQAVLVISEKIAFERQEEQEFQVRMHHTFKELNGYSQLEISQKRTALENILIPDTLETHKRRLQAAGFDDVFVWFQCFNFVSLIAFKK